MEDIFQSRKYIQIAVTKFLGTASFSEWLELLPPISSGSTHSSINVRQLNPLRGDILLSLLL